MRPRSRYEARIERALRSMDGDQVERVLFDLAGKLGEAEVERLVGKVLPLLPAEVRRRWT